MYSEANILVWKIVIKNITKRAGCNFLRLKIFIIFPLYFIFDIVNIINIKFVSMFLLINFDLQKAINVDKHYN
jgi:hypothetical protein